MLTINEISTVSDFYKLKNEWNALLSRSESDNLFLTWDWISNWWNIFGHNKQMKILIAKEDTKLVGIAPFFTSESGTRNTFHIELLGSTNVGSDYLDFIIERGYESNFILKIIDYLRSDSINWQTIHLNGIIMHSKNVELIQNYLADNFYVISIANNICPFICLSYSYEKFFNSLSSSMRYNIKRKKNKFENDFRGEFVVVQDKSQLDEAMEELIKLNMSRAKIKKIYSPFSDYQFSQFHKELARSIFDNGWIKLCFLKIKSELIAGLYIFKYGHKYYFYQSGFNPEWEKLSPGFLLFNYCIECAIAEGMNEFDFLQGSEEYKYDWTKNFRTSLRIIIYRKGLRNKVRYVGEKFSIYSRAKLKESLRKVRLLYKTNSLYRLMFSGKLGKV
jgi:CelD/BcsL family acetyltransferase involved in cellulose biosynthesis